jgi:hypothetical protein
MCAMATHSKSSGWNFYLMGREERRLIKHEIDIAAAAEKFVETGPQDGEDGEPGWRSWLKEACGEAAKSVSTRSKNEWLRENATAISASGMTESHALNLYLAGRVDELYYALEEEFIGAIANEVDDETGVSVH